MAPTKGWKFPLNNGGENKGFNDAALDTFKGQRLSSMVREVIQNSLDAPKVDENEPISVTFKIHEIPRDEAPEITLLRPSLVACKKEAENQELGDAVKFYDNAIKRIDNDDTIRVLVVHDTNSKGLTGPTDENYGPWAALVKGTGITQKKNTSALGSFGHGSKAPFSLSDIRSIFYLSFLSDDECADKRFQGKSILQTHKISDHGNSQGTGYFGWNTSSNCAPLLNDDIPDWALRLREDVGGAPGTTIIIPYFQLAETELPETAISCIANFYYAIEKGSLEVDISGEVALNRANIKDKFYEYRARLDEEKDFIDHQKIVDNFTSLLAVVDPEPGQNGSGLTEVPSLDSFRWFIKIFDDDDDERAVRTRVAIARNDGMLIKHNPWKLERFPLTKPFEMFVCVEDGRGSELLRRLENPQHDDFEFDRIEDWVERQDAEKLYGKLTDKIRWVIKRVAELDSQEETRDSRMDKWFRPSASQDKPGEGTERGKKISVSRTSPRFKKTKPGDFKPGDGPVVGLAGEGRLGGSGKNRGKKGGPFPKPGTGGVAGRGKPSSSGTKLTPLKNLRYIPVTENKVKLVFDNPNEGSHQMIVERIGEEGSERILLAAGAGTFVDQVEITLSHESRQEIMIESENVVAGFALRASLVIEEKGADE